MIRVIKGTWEHHLGEDATKRQANLQSKEPSRKVEQIEAYGERRTGKVKQKPKT